LVKHGAHHAASHSANCSAEGGIAAAILVIRRRPEKTAEHAADDGTISLALTGSGASRKTQCGNRDHADTPLAGRHVETPFDAVAPRGCATRAAP
jgi:hypothetical protein